MSRRRVLESALGIVASGAVGCNEADLSVAAPHRDAGHRRRRREEPARPADAGTVDAGTVDAGTRWARGGTAAMSFDYPDPFTEFAKIARSVAR